MKLILKAFVALFRMLVSARYLLAKIKIAWGIKQTSGCTWDSALSIAKTILDKNLKNKYTAIKLKELK